jgi:hypothetical protein
MQILIFCQREYKDSPPSKPTFLIPSGLRCSATSFSGLTAGILGILLRYDNRKNREQMQQSAGSKYCPVFVFSIIIFRESTATLPLCVTAPPCTSLEGKVTCYTTLLDFPFPSLRFTHLMFLKELGIGSSRLCTCLTFWHGFRIIQTRVAILVQASRMLRQDQAISGKLLAHIISNQYHHPWLISVSKIPQSASHLSFCRSLSALTPHHRE